MNAPKQINAATFWGTFGGLILVIITGVVSISSKVASNSTNIRHIEGEVQDVEQVVDRLELTQRELVKNQALIMQTQAQQLELLRKIADQQAEYNRNIDFFYEMNPGIKRPGRPGN